MTSTYRAIREYIYRYQHFWLKLGDLGCPVKRAYRYTLRWNESLHKPDQILKSSVENLLRENHNQDPTYRGIVSFTWRLYSLGYLQSVDVLESYMKGVADPTVKSFVAGFANAARTERMIRAKHEFSVTRRIELLQEP
ncbi:hypothetical protein RAB80_014422 [Fusarium oxysporum f. sp. vasinfectum]|nr:hypothetical protein RAB80_014422 [Fusarium oxysporum f. sp. vasinfectum]KAK2931673.1 hypothetical protein FoTM2_009189 [Fusarium oxysporum f. sp. vasinfectum]